MSHRTIDGLLFREMMLAGAALLEKNREAVDALNVFPVPDGDTGTNMSLTLMSAVKEVSAREMFSASEAAEAVAKGALKGARGNSGVILSQLFRGFVRGLEGADKIDARAFARGLKAGAETAYKAVMKPKEGTILTVARVISEEAMRQADRAPNDLSALFQVILQSGESILKKTPEMLPVLKQAGVVDAGGRGLLLVYAGMNAALNGEAIESAQAPMVHDGEVSFDDDHEAMEEIKYAYCTEFLIQHLNEKVQEEDVATFRRRLNRIGDCVLVVGDLSLVKVHVHTNDPGKALQAGLALGELVNLKIENMVEQRRERVAKMEEEAAKEQKYGMVAVSLGEGFSRIFQDLGVNKIVEGGQTMNPSVEDLLGAIDSVPAKTVYIFPNNGNVVFAAQQAAELSRREVLVIPTKNVAMGIAAAVVYQEDLEPQVNAQRMTEAAERVKTGMITRAIRDTQFESLDIHEGDCIGLFNGKIAVNGKDEHEVALALMQLLIQDEDALITVYFGEDATETDADILTEEIMDLYSNCDVELHNGGQPVYPYIISVE